MAEREIHEAARWYDERQPRLGDEFLEAVEQAVALALESPQHYPRIHGHMRRVLVHRFPYAVFFRETADELVVLGCIHGRRDSRRWESLMVRENARGFGNVEAAA